MIIELEHIEKTYGTGANKVPVLHDVNMQVEAGEYIAIMGPSGSGKSTLMNLLGYLDVPTSGVYRFDGQDNAKAGDARMARIRNEKIGFVFQSFHLMPELDIVENVVLPAMTGAVKIKSPRARAKELLAKVGLADRLDHLPNELSGGEQQRVALARALMCSPRIVLADEPTGNLDRLTGAEIMKLLFEVSETPFALVMVTHSQEAAALCDRILTLDHGHIL